MDKQLSLYEGERQRDEGTQRVLAHTPEGWRAAALLEARRCLTDHGSFTSQDIINAIGMPPNHPNAVGAMVRSIACELGLRKGARIKSPRVTCHAAEIAIWHR